MGAFVIPRGLLILPVLLILFVSYSSGTEVVTIDIYKAKSLLDSGYGYLDIRTKKEFKNGHINVTNIINIPYMFSTPKGMVKNPNYVKHILSAYGKYAHLIVGCEIGLRSVNATADLVNAGFEHVFNMDGGYTAWVKNEFPVKKLFEVHWGLSKVIFEGDCQTLMNLKPTEESIAPIIIDIQNLLLLEDEFSLHWIPSSGTEVVSIDIYMAKNFLNVIYGYLDVRTEEEFKNGHVDVKNITNIPYTFNTPQGFVKNPDFVKQVLSVYGKYAHIVVGCQTGLRSFNATADLLNAGFKHVFNMDGGYVAWVKNGLPISGTRVVTIESYQAKTFLAITYGYLDVRTKEEFKKGHVDVKNIRNIPYKFNTSQGMVNNPHFVKQVLSTSGKYAHLIVGCQTGSRSINATTDLVYAGFKHVFNMNGGYAKWVLDGFPVTKP